MSGEGSGEELPAGISTTNPGGDAPIFSRKPATIERALLLVLAAAFFATAFVPAWRHLNSDFPNYYLVAKLYRAGYPLDRVYEWTWLQREKDHQGIDRGVVAFVPLTLPSALAVAPLTSLSPLAAQRCWFFANLVFLALTALLLTRITSLGWTTVAVLISLAIATLRSNFVLGQMHVLVLLLITLGAWLYLRKSPFLSGISLAGAAALKIYPGLFLIFFLFKRQWRAAAGLLTGLAGTVLLSIYLFGRDACFLYAREIVPWALRGETIDPYNAAWGSITGLLRRLFIAEPELNPAPVAHLPWLYAFLQPAIHGILFVVFMGAMGSQKGDDFKMKRDWAIYVFLLLFLSSQPAGYHFVVFIVAAVLIYEEMITRGKHWLARIVAVIYALICTATLRLPWADAHGWHTLLFFPRLFLLTAFGGVLLCWTFWTSSESLRDRLSPRNLAVAGSVLVLIVGFGFFSTRRHLGGLFDNYSHRVLTKVDSTFASDPTVTPDRVLASAMTTGGYTIRVGNDGAIREFPRTKGADWFHPSAPQQSDSVWIEQASQGGSSVLQVAVDFGQGALPQALSAIQNAQEPVVSRDGQWLAFLRSIQGRNSLWMHRIEPASSHSGLVEAKEIVGMEYDVREVTFLPDHALIFSSKRNGQFRLYRTGLSGGVIELSAPPCSARYPAASPDGQRLAFSCEEQGNWQLHTMKLPGDHERRLTTAECNSISPAWTPDSRHLIYATDCGRGIGLTALAEIDATQ